MGQRAVLADDVYRFVRRGEVDAHVLRHSGEGGKQTQQLGVGGLLGEVKREALRGAGRYTIISHPPQVIQAQHELHAGQRLGTAADHPLAEALEVRVAAAAQQELQIVPSGQAKCRHLHAHGLLVLVETAEEARDLQDGDRGIDIAGGKRGRRGEGIVRGGDQNGGERGHGDALLESLENALERANLGKSDGLGVAGEFDADRVNVGGLRVRKGNERHGNGDALGLKRVVHVHHISILLDEVHGAGEGAQQHVLLHFSALAHHLAVAVSVHGGDDNHQTAHLAVVHEGNDRQLGQLVHHHEGSVVVGFQSRILADVQNRGERGEAEFAVILLGSIWLILSLELNHAVNGECELG